MAETDVTPLHRLAGWVGYLYLQVVGKTSFIYKHDHPAYLDFRRNRKPAVYAFWHNHQVFLSYAHRNESVNIIVSRSKDGEYIAQVMKRMGLNAVRGSTSKGGNQALMEMISLLDNKQQVGFTPDGPRGPAHTVQGGVVMAAQATGAPIIPTAYITRRKIVFNSWDKFVLPLPFSTTIVAHGEPFTIGKEESLDDAKERVRDAIDKIGEEAAIAEKNAPTFAGSLIGFLLFSVYKVLAFVLLPLLLGVAVLKYGVKRTSQSLAERFWPAKPVKAREGAFRLWFHAASVGEWQALKPVLREMKKTVEAAFLVTVSTPEARGLVSRDEPELDVSLMPVDFPWVVRSWIEKARPDAACVIETELWPNLLNELNRANIPSIIINGRLSSRSFTHWRLFKPFAWRLLNSATEFLVRTPLDGQRFCRLGAFPTAVHVLGNTKYDNLNIIKEGERAAMRNELFGNGDGFFVVGGSTWPTEEATLLKLFSLKSAVPQRLRLIVAPRRLSRVSDVVRAFESVAASWSAWSEVKKTGAWDTDILLVDTLGDLGRLYRTADLAFVGGSLYPHGGQNPLEPASAAVPVLFGPSMENFHEEAADLKQGGAARQARHEKDFLMDAQEIMTDAGLRQMMSEASARIVSGKQGASTRTAAMLRDLLKI